MDLHPKPPESETVGSSMADVVFPASAPVPSRSQQKRKTNSLQWVLLGGDLVISPTCNVGDAGQFPEGPIGKGHELVLGYLFMVFSDQP